MTVSRRATVCVQNSGVLKIRTVGARSSSGLKPVALPQCDLLYQKPVSKVQEQQSRATPSWNLSEAHLKPWMGSEDGTLCLGTSAGKLFPSQRKVPQTHQSRMRPSPETCWWIQQQQWTALSYTAPLRRGSKAGWIIRFPGCCVISVQCRGPRLVCFMKCERGEGSSGGCWHGLRCRASPQTCRVIWQSGVISQHSPSFPLPICFCPACLCKWALSMQQFSL